MSLLNTEAANSHFVYSPTSQPTSRKPVKWPRDVKGGNEMSWERNGWKKGPKTKQLELVRPRDETSRPK